MNSLPAAVICLGLMLGTTTAHAVDTDAVIGGAIGGAIGGGAGAAVGSELGGRSGAIAGSAMGAAIGTAIATNGENDHAEGEHVYYDNDRRRPPAHAFREPPGHVKHNKHKHDD